MASKDSRSRNWTFIVYPESVPEYWRSYLDDMHIPWIESPLHDKDTNADGEPKKTHIHVLLLFSGKKSYEQIKEITDALNCPIPQICHDARSLTRYFAHLDNPEKWQYNVNDIIGHGGADPVEYLDLLKSKLTVVLKEIFEFCGDYGMTEYSDFIEYCIYHDKQDWFKVATQYSTLALNTYFASARYRSKGGNS